MKKLFTTSLLALAVSAILFATSGYAQDLQALITTDDESLLIETIQKPGDAPEDIHVKNVACKRLAVIGTAKAIPSLAAMLSNEKLNFNARYALEAMPFAESDAALAQAAQELTGSCLVGVVDTIGVRAKSESFALLKDLASKNDDVLVKKAIYAAMGKIATPEARAYLTEEAQKDFSGSDLLLKRGLGDAILDVAEELEKANDKSGALELYSLLTSRPFPSFVQDAGLYRSLLCSDGAQASAKIVETLKSANASSVDAALKTVREFDAEAGLAVAEALVKTFDQYPEATQVRIVRALGDRVDDGSREVAYARLSALAKDGSLALKVASAQGLQKLALNESAAFDIFASNVDNFNDETLSAAIVAMASAFESDDFNAAWKKFCETELVKSYATSEKACLAFMKIAELRRSQEAAPALTKIAETQQGALRDGALSTLSEIVDLDNLGFLVDALNGETDDAKVDWLLRAACTRLPREACAEKIAELFSKADLDSKLKTLPLLKQIGGGAALLAVAQACNGDTLDKATQILGEWNTPEDATNLAEICLTIARQAKDMKYHSRGIRGYIRVARQFELPVSTKIAMCKTAFETARRSEDKALIFEVFKRNIVADNVAAALEYAQYDEFKDAACEAAVFVAEKIRKSQQDWDWTAPTDDQAKAQAGKILVDSMKKVVETTTNADLKARAQKLL